MPPEFVPWLVLLATVEALVIVILGLANWSLVAHLRFIDQMIDETDSAAMPLIHKRADS